MAENNSSAPLKTAEWNDLAIDIAEHTAEADAICRKLYNQYGYEQTAKNAREWIQIAKQLLDDAAQAVAAQAPAAVAVPDERTAFEAVASDNGKWPKAIEHDSKGNYFLMGTASGWTWWQARAALAATPAAKPAVCDSVHIDDFCKVDTPAASAEAQAEPEHWVLEHNDPSREFDYTGVKAKAMDWIRIGLNPTPLYPAPQASKPVPLTDAQILKLARLAGYLAGDPSRAAFINGLRAGEKANGIGASNAD